MSSKKLRIVAVGVLFAILVSIIVIGCLALNSIITWETFLLSLTVIVTIGFILLVMLVLLILYLIDRSK